MSQTVMALNLAGIVPVGNRDLDSNDSVSQNRGGTYAFMLDGFGPRLFRYGQNRHTANLAQGSMTSRVGDNNGATSAGTITAGTTTSITTSGLTANQHVGAICYITDDAGAAGAAPEGESSIVVTQSATLIKVDPDMPYSAAIAASDTASLLGTYNINASAADDLNWVCFGVVMGVDGIDATNFGWCQSWGMCPNAIATTAAVSVNKPLVAGTGTILTGDGTDPFNVVIGYAPIGAASDLASPFRTLVFLTMDFGFVPSDIDSNAT